ncbi:MAG: hypothetical protein JRH11_16055 [Deltaproteobacteria bacterium]|nr:hypothetical protein [Deltaproteobacteria bacterium]
MNCSLWSVLLFATLGLAGLNACRDDGGVPSDAALPDAADAGLDAPISDDGGADADASPADGGADAGPLPPTQNVVVGHLGGASLQIDQFDLGSLAATTGSPLAMAAYNDLIPLPRLDAIAVVLPSDSSVVVLGREGLTALPGSPYGQATTPLTLGHDSARNKLYVYGADGPSERRMTVYDTSEMPFVEVPGSPFDVDIVATEIRVDEATGRIFGISSSTVWAAEIVGSSFNMLFDTPLTDASPTSLVIDSERRRLYYTAAVPSRLFARDLDSFAPMTGSPLTLPGNFPSGVVLDSSSGDLFVLDGAPAGHLVHTTPLALADTCGSPDGCVLPTTETGIAIDEASDRLFITIRVPGEAGRLGVWDISTPATPAESTNATTRPTVGEFPAWVFVY